MLLLSKRKAFRLFVVRKQTRSKGFRKVSQGGGCFLGSVSSKSTVFGGLSANAGIHSYFPTEGADVYHPLFLSRKESTETYRAESMKRESAPRSSPHTRHCQPFLGWLLSASAILDASASQTSACVGVTLRACSSTPWLPARAGDATGQRVCQGSSARIMQDTSEGGLTRNSVFPDSNGD